MNHSGSFSVINCLCISLWILPCDITVFPKIPKLLKDKARTSVTVLYALVYCFLSSFPKHSKPYGRHCVLSKSQNNSVVLECRLGLSMLTKRHRSLNALVREVPLTFNPKLPAQEYSSPKHAKRCS
jgi:hypothetical protein